MHPRIFISFLAILTVLAFSNLVWASPNVSGTPSGNKAPETFPFFPEAKEGPFTVGQNCPRPSGSVAITIGDALVVPGQSALIPISFSQVCPGQGGDTLQFDILLDPAVVNLSGSLGILPGPALPFQGNGALRVARHPSNQQAIRVTVALNDPNLSFSNGLFCTLQLPTQSGFIYRVSNVEMKSGAGFSTFINQTGVGPVRIGSTNPNGQLAGTLTVAPSLFCPPQLDLNWATAPGNGMTGEVNVTTSSGCLWSAESDVPWISFLSSPIGTESAVLQYAVARNHGAARTGSFWVGEQQFTVYQAALGAETIGGFRPTDGAVFLRNSNSFGYADTQFFFGQAGDKPIVGDWNGDGVDTFGIFRNGVFYLRNANSTGFADIQFAFGASGDLPIAGDWDGDGVTTVGVVRGNQIFLRNSNTAGAPDGILTFGSPGDVILAGDWNGDGIDTIGAFRPSVGYFFLKNSNTSGFADAQFAYGAAGDIPVVGDWNGDGVDTIGIVRNGEWFLRNGNTSGFADLQFFYGVPTDVPVVGHWTGQ